jgi:hypothetical protein
MSKKHFYNCAAGLLFATSALATIPIVVATEMLIVDDPTGTPLNIRGVRGKIICTVSNGEAVEKIPKDGAFAYLGPEWTTIRTRSGCLGRAWTEYLRRNY